MRLYNNFDELNRLIFSVENSGSVVFIPAFSGLFSPYWRDDVRGTISGLSLHTERAHILRAMTDGILMRCKEVIDVMETDCEGVLDLSQIYVDGGVSNNSVLMQTQAEFINKNVMTKQESEITGIGAAIAAGLKVGVWSGLDEIKNLIQVKDTYTPKLPDEVRVENEEKWKQAVQKALN